MCSRCCIRIAPTTGLGKPRRNFIDTRFERFRAGYQRRLESSRVIRRSPHVRGRHHGQIFLLNRSRAQRA